MTDWRPTGDLLIWGQSSPGRRTRGACTCRRENSHLLGGLRRPFHRGRKANGDAERFGSATGGYRDSGAYPTAVQRCRCSIRLLMRAKVIEASRIGERHTADTSPASVSLPTTCCYIVNASASLSGSKVPTRLMINRANSRATVRRPCRGLVGSAPGRQSSHKCKPPRHAQVAITGRPVFLRSNAPWATDAQA